MRRLLKVAAWAVAIIVVGLLALVVYAIGPATLRLMDREVLAGLAGGVIALSKPFPTVAERTAAGGTLRYEEKFIPGAAGDPPVRIVIVEPKDAVPGRPGILDLHGGGFTHGSPESSLTMLVEELVLKLGVTVVSVDYRLAPATRWPGSLHDNYAALQWFHANAQALGVDARRIGVTGFSAGGGHAAALAILARDRGGPPILFQALLSPALDDRTGSTLEPGESLGGFPWTREDNRKAWTALLGVDAGSEQVPAEAVPMRVADLTRLPPTYIAVGSLDLFATESAAFADRLRAAGVPVELKVYAGGIHGFEVLVPSARLSRQSRQELVAYVLSRS